MLLVATPGLLLLAAATWCAAVWSTAAWEGCYHGKRAERCLPAPPLPLSQDYRVFTGGSMEEVRAAYTRGEHAWCGLARMLHGSPNCTVAARPHGSTFVAIAKPKTWLGACNHADGCKSLEG